MQVGESTLKELIEGEKQFQVPLYQRQYSWTTPELSQLWDDILEQYDLLIPDEAGLIEGDAPPHFLGSMVLAPSPKMQAQGVTPFLVIDGQQRLTTLLLTLCAVRDHAALNDPLVTERFNERYLINKYGDGLTYYRLLPTQADRESFFACVKDVPEGTGDTSIGKAYKFFRAKLLQEDPDGKPIDTELVESVLRNRLQFVVITAAANDNVHRIFESLNDRGIRLSQADLLRNYVFMLLPNRRDSVYEETWEPMQRRLTASQLEDLVFVDLILRGNMRVKRRDIYRAQQNRLRPIQDDEKAVELEVEELARRSFYFERIVNPSKERDLEIRAGLSRLHQWGATTTYPLLMHVFDLWERGDCSVTEVKEVLQNVESFLVRRLLANVPTNNLNRVFQDLIQQLPDLPIVDAVRHALSGERKFWPTDGRLREAIVTEPFYYYGRHEQKMLIFRRLEESFAHAEPVNFDLAKLSIEHIMPQSLTDEWRADLSVHGDDAEETHEELLHTLGNLTVTAYNGALSNNPFERKKQILEGSHLELNRTISPNERWRRKEILIRAKELADRAIAIWPAPLPGVRDAKRGRDWSRLHSALAALPAGAWTTYADVAELVGSHQVPVGQHLATTPGVPNSHRVLNSEGRVSEGFHWIDPNDARDVHEVLKAEGVLDSNLVADPTQRLKSEDLAALVDEVFEAEEPDFDREYGWRWRRLLRYLRYFYESEDGRLHESEAQEIAIKEGYDPRGLGGFYQGTPSLEKHGDYRVLTDAGRQLFEENKYRLVD